MAVESYQLRGKNYDDVVRQLISTYNSSQGWSLVRVVNRLTSLDVILERNSEQGKETQKEASTDTSTDTSTGTTQPLETKEIVADEAPTSEKPAAVKTTRKSQRGG